MGLQLTASKTALLLQCPRPFAPSTEIEIDKPGDAALYGSAFHECMAISIGALHKLTPPKIVDFREVAACWGARRIDPQILGQHVKQALEAIQNFIGGQNPWGCKLRVVSVEEAGGLGPNGERVPVTFYPETHTYESSDELLVAGSADLILERIEPAKGRTITQRVREKIGPRRLVLDYKTGHHGPLFHKPAEMPQMRTLGAIFQASHVGIVDTPPDGIPQIYCDEFEEPPDSGILRELRQAFALAQSDLGPLMRTGSECKYCPARHDCPTRTADVVKASAEIAGVSVRALAKLQISDADAAGRFHQLRSELARLEKLALDETREMVRSGVEVVRPDGKVLGLENRTYERLSKSSILKAYGPEKGAKLLDEMRKKGALAEETREELRAK